MSFTGIDSIAQKLMEGSGLVGPALKERLGMANFTIGPQDFQPVLQGIPQGGSPLNVSNSGALPGLEQIGGVAAAGAQPSPQMRMPGEGRESGNLMQFARPMGYIEQIMNMGPRYA
jgi:hypothetical protein